MSISPNLIGLRVRYLILIDSLCIILAVLMSFMIRYEALVYVLPYVQRYWTLFILAPLVRLPIYYKFGLYRRLWRYASIVEFKKIILAGFVGFLVVYSVNLWLFPLLSIPYSPSRSVLIIEAGISMAFLGITRLILRLLQENIASERATRLKIFTQTPKKILIMGAGDAGVMVLREAQANPSLGLAVVGFIDDDRNKLKMSIHDVPVLGTRDDIPSLASKFYIDEIIIAMPTASGKDVFKIKAICEQAGVKCKTVPGIYELIDGTISFNQIRDVQIEDLLRRTPVSPDLESIRYLHNTVIMVTGAGGSIGSELARQVAQQLPRQLILLDQGETPLYKIDMELCTRYPSMDIQSVLADIRDLPRIERVFKQYHPEIIFHAAAYKHVPLMEANPEEVVLNNIVGTQNLLQVAEKNNVMRFVLISTDKAVNPSNFMGASKRVAELLLQNIAQRNKKQYVAVRFGNVLGSQGSVIPLFKQQIANGGPVTITHRDMERYFMTIPEAVQLVLQAATLGDGGDIFVLDMGEPVKIIDLARDLISLSGLEPEKDIEIIYTGLRPGEKLYEQLFNERETHTKTSHEKIFVVTEETQLNEFDLQYKVQNLVQAAQNGDVSQLWELIQSIVPESKKTLIRTGEVILSNGNEKHIMK